jgi:cytochrome c oxidase assembly factor CtaG
VNAALLVLLQSAAYAHAGHSAAAETSITPESLWSRWSFDPVVVAALLLSAALYLRGVRALWRASGKGRGIRRWEAGSFGAGWMGLFIALLSPLHPLGEVLFSAHMSQHEVLMLVAAPLLVLGRPLIPFLWGLPIRWRRHAGAFTKRPVIQRIWRVVSSPFGAWAIHALALWIWHAPILFQATLDNDFVHSLQHTSFLFSALLFCWSLLNGPERRMSYGTGIISVFTTAVHSSILGALLTVSQTIWYPAYAGGTSIWGLTPLEDQQLGGLIMWVPAGTVYLVAGLLLFAAWMRGRAEEPTPSIASLRLPLSSREGVGGCESRVRE